MTNDTLDIMIRHKVGSNSIWSSITEFVVTEGFPEGFEEQLKGEGYFDYQVKSFTFQAISPMLYYASGEYHADKPIRYDLCDIWDGPPENRQKVFSGFVDEIQDTNDESTIEITVFPSAVILKDFDIGVLDTQDDEINREFETGLLHVRDIGSAMLTYVNNQSENKAGIEFSLDESSVPDNNHAPNSLPFVGTILEKLKRKGGSWFLRRFVFGQIEQDEFEGGGNNSKCVIRKKGDEYYLVRTEARWGLKTLINARQWIDVDANEWLNFTIHVPTPPYVTVVFNHNFPRGFGWLEPYVPSGVSLVLEDVNFGVPFLNIYVPSEDIKIPAPEARYTVYKMIGGNLEFHAVHNYFPLFPFNETPNNNDQGAFSIYNLYGEAQTGNDTGNISQNKIINFVRKKNYDTVYVQSTVDVDANNTFAFVHASKKYHVHKWDEYEVGSMLVIVFETAFDEYYKVKYLNKTPMEIFKDLCKVSNRYFYVDADNKIFMLPRGDANNAPQSMGISTLNYNDILSKKVKRHREVEVDIDINRWEDSDDGFSSYGIRLREAELQSIKKFYHDLFSRERIEYKIKFLLSPSASRTKGGLMRHLVVSNAPQSVDYGQIIERSNSFSEPTIEIKTEAYV